MINPVKFTGTEKPLNTNENKAPKQEKTTEAAAEEKAYVVDIGNSTEKKATYGNPSVGKPDIQRMVQLQKQADEALRPLRQMVEELLKRQGMSFNAAHLKPFEGEMAEIDDETRAEAQRLIAEDGEFGIENTADRIFEFAKAVSGNDKTKLGELKAAIEKGYQAAEKAFGGALPEISKKTLERTLEKLEKWATSEEE